MFTLLLMRRGPHHIVNYYTHGIYRTICGESHHKSTKVNTLSADNTFDGLCKTCKHYYDEMYQADLNYYPRDARGSVVFTEDMIYLHRIDIVGPKAKYSDVMNYRFSSKLNKYKRLILRDQVKIKNGK